MEIESSLRNVVLEHKQNDILDKDEMMDNVQERNICSKMYDKEIGITV
jgi:hypothetical protein